MSGPIIQAEGHVHGKGLTDLVALPTAGVLTVGADGKGVARSGGTNPPITNDRNAAFTCAALSVARDTIALGDASAFVKVHSSL